MWCGKFSELSDYQIKHALRYFGTNAGFMPDMAKVSEIACSVNVSGEVDDGHIRAAERIESLRIRAFELGMVSGQSQLMEPLELANWVREKEAAA